MVELFDNEESNYLDWIRQNSDGFVANVDRECRVPEYPMVHLATHRLISSEKIGNFTTGDYVKFCSTSLAELEQYSLSRFGRRLVRCAVCEKKLPR